MNNMTDSTHLQHPASVDAYIRQGWKLVPIPQGTKGPDTKGWNRQENSLVNGANLPHGYGIGLAHAYSGTMALDVDHWERACQELAKVGIDLQALYEAPDAVTIDSGKPGHGKLLYTMPFGAALHSKKLIDTAPDGSKYNYLDFRCGTANGLTVQDILPPTIHPETQQPYRWGGKGHWSRPPVIPMPLLAYWESLIREESERKVSDGTLDASWDDIRTALYHVPADISRDEWVSVGMALHWAGQQIEQDFDAYLLWNDWSSTGEKFKGQKDTSNCWRSFHSNNGITIGTLFHIAGQHGWKRPVPSPDELFADVETEKPVDMMAGFRPPAPDMNMTLWPDVLRTRAEEIASSVGCDPLVPLFAGLAVVAGAMDARSRLELMPGYRVPPVLWLMTLGDPADKKSPGSRPLTSALKELEQADRPRYKQAMLEWEGQEAAYGASHKNFLEYYSSAEHGLDNDTVPMVPELPPQPVPLKITVQDITSQKLVRHAAERPRGLLCWLDEMNSWVKKVTDPRSGEDRSAWVMSYESDTYEMDRVGAGSIWCENLAVSIYGNIQPRVFRQNMTNMANDGLVQRFIPAILRGGMTRLGNPIPDVFSSKPLWDQTVKTVFTLPERVYTLSSDAYTVYREFQQWYESTKQDERTIQADDTYMTAFGKLEGQAGRLALVLHAIENPYSQEVSGDLMQRVIEIIRSYVIPALRYAFGEVGGLAESTLDSWMASHILALTADTRIGGQVTLRDLKHSARRRIDDKPAHLRDQAVLESMQTLEACQWVALVDANPRTNHYVWQINPALADVFKEQRDNVIRVKQARYDENRAKTGNRASRRLVPGYDPEVMD